MTIDEEFLTKTPRKTIMELKDSKEKILCVVLATINVVIDQEDWWYTACSCGKAVYPDSKMYFCEKCNRHIMNVIPRMLAG
ncbi:unnamed protein product [Cuscuta epithymum]|uniref:Replication factor A C-terminal domain-containing protein n=1 Tax=Cuscuta epithymum TaxID=186058 RepID=A0AAV0ETT9_9ASTE|nr:unnamed protein product [Cuscuta epithymum]